MLPVPFSPLRGRVPLLGFLLGRSKVAKQLFTLRRIREPLAHVVLTVFFFAFELQIG
jgi:hypothetical protein